MKTVALLAALVLAGCDFEERPYTVRFIRPDGQTHRTITVRSPMEPFLSTYDGIVYLDVIGGQRLLVPTGWMVEVEPQVER